MKQDSIPVQSPADPAKASGLLKRLAIAKRRHAHPQFIGRFYCRLFPLLCGQRIDDQANGD